MGKKKTIALVLSLLLIIGVFGGVTVVVTQNALSQQAEEPAAAEDEVLSGEDNPDVETMKATAEGLIGEELTMEEIQEKIGQYENFDLDSNGCERGVMAGLFYYKGFTVRSRTYDRGSTFTISSVR